MGSVARAFPARPLSFEENHGQANASNGFVGRSSSLTVLLGSSDAIFVLKDRRSAIPHDPEEGPPRSSPSFSFRMKLVGGNTASHSVGVDRLPGVANYFIGDSPEGWRTNIPTYGGVKVTGVYPGIDLVYHGQGGHLEYDFVVAPGADIGSIRVAFDNVEDARVNHQGDLVLTVDGHDVIHRRPRVFQDNHGHRTELGSAYVILPNREIAFNVSGRDSSQTTIIDPVLDYSAFEGGTGYDEGKDIAVDGSGNIYITGNTYNFPVSANAFQATVGGMQDAFVMKLAPDGSVRYATYLGGTLNDYAFGIAVDGNGNAYVTGQTYGYFPVKKAVQAKVAGDYDAFLAKLTTTGDLDYSTYIGGTGYDAPRAVAVDTAGNAYITGVTVSNDLKGATQRTSSRIDSDAFVARLSSDGSSLFTTYVGDPGVDETGYGIAIDPSGTAHITGTGTVHVTGTLNPGVYNGCEPNRTLPSSADVFVATVTSAGAVSIKRFNASGVNCATGIALDPTGNTFVVGYTSLTSFPTKNAYAASYLGGAYDAFVSKLASDGSFIYSTFFGSSGTDFGRGIAVDSAGDAYITGEISYPSTYASATNKLPVPNAFQTDFAGGTDGFLAKFDPTGALLYSSYVGGTGDDSAYAVAVDGAGNAYLTGSTSSNQFPALTGAPTHASGSTWQPDAFVAIVAAPASVGVRGVVPSGGPLAGGNPVTIVGNNFAVGATVSFGGTPATGVVVKSATTIECVAPQHAAGAFEVVVGSGGATAQLSGAYTYADAPTVSSVTPNSGTYKGGFQVTITGTGFQSGAAVTFGSVSASSIDVQSATQLTATAPAYTTGGAVDVVVTNLDGQSGTLSKGFEYSIPPPPTVTSITPTTGSSIGGVQVTITGSNFLTGATVKFRDHAAESVTVVNDTTITAVTPSLSAGAADVTVTNPDGQSSTLAASFTYFAQQTNSGCSTGGSDSLLALFFAAGALRGIKRRRHA
jgi:hypothetical protein